MDTYQKRANELNDAYKLTVDTDCRLDGHSYSNLCAYGSIGCLFIVWIMRIWLPLHIYTLLPFLITANLTFILNICNYWTYSEMAPEMLLIASAYYNNKIDVTIRDKRIKENTWVRLNRYIFYAKGFFFITMILSMTFILIG